MSVSFSSVSQPLLTHIQEPEPEKKSASKPKAQKQYGGPGSFVPAGEYPSSSDVDVQLAITRHPSTGNMREDLRRDNIPPALRASHSLAQLDLYVPPYETSRSRHSAMDVMVNDYAEMGVVDHVNRRQSFPVSYHVSLAFRCKEKNGANIPISLSRQDIFLVLLPPLGSRILKDCPRSQQMGFTRIITLKEGPHTCTDQTCQCTRRDLCLIIRAQCQPTSRRISLHMNPRCLLHRTLRLSVTVAQGTALRRLLQDLCQCRRLLLPDLCLCRLILRSRQGLLLFQPQPQPQPQPLAGTDRSLPLSHPRASRLYRNPQSHHRAL